MGDCDPDELREIYESGSRVGLKPMMQKVKRAGLNCTTAEVKAFLARQKTVQVNRKYRKPKEYTSIRAPKAGSNYQADLMFWERASASTKKVVDGKKIGLVQKVVDGKKTVGLLNVVDVHSRRAWSVPIAGKGTEKVIAAFESVLRDGVPEHLNTDNGTEFINAGFQELLQRNGITHWLSRKDEFAKNAIVERFNRTVREAMKLQESRDVPLYTDWQRYIVKPYNNEEHSTINAVPMDVWTGGENKQKYKDPQYDLNVGDRVRVVKEKDLFEKGGRYEWSEEVETIVRVVKSDKTPKLGASLSSGRYYVSDDEYYMGYQLLKVEAVEGAGDPAKAAQRAAAKQKSKAKGKQERALEKEGISEAADADAGRQTRGRTRGKADPKALEGKRIWIRWDAEGPITQKAKRDRGAKGETKATALVVSYFPGLKRYRVKWDDNGDVMDLNLNDTRPFADAQNTLLSGPGKWTKTGKEKGSVNWGMVE